MRAYVSDRFNKDQVLAGDPDYTLGVKHSTNQEQPDGSTKEKGDCAPLCQMPKYAKWHVPVPSAH
ncbi:hypothetical protein KDA_47000 [Dictyobacter alpinus]|uniref:Uncharacterized protein n=1 Tax=Dictyobacter alpinus TaxID=2014873 RepID=A0A402BD01_9CHLR|nr:hypothetical protein [Dictyobacter alpinus]GCE29216.1 hypothetical protein KDA_47000 [Dictyobacter alpinus]